MHIQPSKKASPDTPAAHATLACAADPDLFLHPLLEVPPARSKVAKAVWQEYRELLDRGRDLCAACPIFIDCLYTSVAQVDIAGYVGCTTPKERKAIRSRLDVTLVAEDLDVAAGVRGDRRPVDHDTVMAARSSFPDDSLDQLAARLECSLSTVKRHLRRARREAVGGDAEMDRPQPHNAAVPTVDDVLDAFDSVVETDR